MAEQAKRKGISRRTFLKGVGIAGAALALRQPNLVVAQPGRRDRVIWISPRGTLEVMDDYNLWVPVRMGYFDELGLDVQLLSGTITATDPTRFLASGQADVGYPSPGVLTTSIDQGLPILSGWEMVLEQVFDFSLPPDSAVTGVQELAGKRIAVGSIGWQSIIDPILVEAGVDPKSVEYVPLGAQWSQAVALGQVDAGLAWEGLRAQLLGQGLNLRFLIGREFSRHPSNVYAIRQEDFGNTVKRNILTRFFTGCVMGFEFAQANPQAAAQITYGEFPALQASLSPQGALDSMIELGFLYSGGKRAGRGWGWHDVESWDNYLDTVRQLGQITGTFRAADILTNHFVDIANADAGVERARADAEAFELNEAFAATEVKGML